eukprot:Em0005g790a
MYVRFLIFLVAVRVTTQDSCVSVQVSAKCSGDSYPACQSLENVFLNLSSGQWPGKCVTLDLLDGVHSLMTPIFINATADFSLSIIGSNSSLVSCAFSSSNATNLHSIHLYGLNTVVISSVSAYGCDRPFRLQNVGYLRIVNSTFKSFVGGGALDVYNCLATEIVDCSFEDNYATFRYTRLPLLEGNSVTASNGGGGGVVVTLFIPLDKRFPNNVLISNCTLLRNQAHYGGGAYVLPALSPGDGYYVSFENSLFDGNYASEYAAAIGFASLAFFQSFAALHPYRISSCTFRNNVAITGGIIGVPYIPVVMNGHNVFTNNTGATLRVIGATLTLNGTFEFIGNNADTSDGGAIYVTSQGQLILTEGLLLVSMAITEGTYDALRVHVPEVSGFTKLLYNPLCFIRYEDNQLSPFLWKGLNVSFSGNSALIGPVAYISQLDFCSWRGLTEPFFDSQNIIKWPFVTADGSNRNLGHPSESIGDRTLYVQTPAASLHIESTSFSVFAGETVPLKLESLDEIGHPTYAIFRVANSVSQPTGEPSLWAMAPVGVPALKTYHCPNGYCIQIYNTSAGPNTHGSVYTYNSPDAQCNCNRSGVLCGSCPQGCGVSVLTNRCVTCGNENGLLILALCVVVVMATIAISDLPPSTNGRVLPMSLCHSSEEFPISFESIHPYLYYISSFLALYFPYDFCLLNNLNPLASYFLRYTPPLLVSLTVVITLVIRKKVLRLRSIPCSYYGGQRVILDKMCLHLDHIFRWYVDGTVECFTQGHLPLALFSILALVLEAGLIPLVVMISMEKLKSNQDGCVVSGFTRFTGLLTPFYYLPLLAGVVCIAVGVASLLRAWNLPHAVRQQSTRIVSSSVHHSAVEEVGDYWHSTDYRLIQDDSPVVKM